MIVTNLAADMELEIQDAIESGADTIKGDGRISGR